MKTITGLLQKTASITLTTALVGTFLLQYFAAHSPVRAGTFQSASVTISNSQASATAVTYDFAMTASTDTAIKQIDITFCTTPTGACTPPTGMDVGANPTLASDNISGTDRTTTNPTDNNTIRVVVTTPATQDPLGITMQFTGITNPSTTASFYARVVSFSDTGSTMIDEAQMGMATLASGTMAVTADVGPTLTVSVAAVTTGAVNGADITITSGTSASTIPFGVLTIGTPAIAAHDIGVTTNANNGYQITVKATDPPLADGSNNIDFFTGTNGTPTTWSEPDGTAKSVNTGFFGYTTNDATLAIAGGAVDRFTSNGGDKWAGFTTSADQAAYSATAIASEETTRIGWQIEVNGLQPPGSYTGTITMVVTPTY